jgi:hypothetical protein
MHLQPLRHRLVDGVENSAKILGRVTRPAHAHHPAGADIQSGKQIRCAMANVIVRVTLNLTGAHGQDRGGGRSGLDLGLLVHAQRQRPIRWVEIEPNNVADLVDEERIARELEGLPAMGLQRESAWGA